MNVPPSDGMAAFLAAARSGSFSAAALELGVTHAAISRRIQAMEHWAGARLFLRYGRGVRLTDVGEHLSKTIAEALQRINDVAGDARQMHSRTRVRLGVLPSLARLWIMPRIVELEGEPSDITIQITAEHRIAEVNGRETDLAIRYGKGGWVDVVATPLLRENFFPVATPEIAARVRETPDGLLGETLLHDTDTGDWRRWMNFARIPYSPKRGERFFVDYDLALLAAASGLGVAMGRTPLVDRAITEGLLEPISSIVMPSDRAHYLISRQNKTRAAVIRLIERFHRSA